MTNKFHRQGFNSGNRVEKYLKEKPKIRIKKIKLMGPGDLGLDRYKAKEGKKKD